jgi:homoserine/homoserine lactone efflux protein
MTLDGWLLFCATETVLCFTPGPAVLLVVSTALARGAGAGLAAGAGILAANAGYFALSATSLGAALAGSERLYVVITWLGAAYLVWTGAGMMLRRGSFGRGSESSHDGHVTLESRATPSFRRGVITQAANPKAIVFFTALLPQFIDPSQPVVPQVVILGVSSIVIEFIVLGVYVAACHGARRWLGSPRFAPRLERAGGAFLAAAGLRLAVDG